MSRNPAPGVSFYLGQPGAMRRLPSPRIPIDNPASYAEETWQAWDGGTRLARSANVKRGYSLTYGLLTDAESDVVTAFYDGLFGRGPFRLVDPSVRNYLPLDDSAFGARHTWTVSAGTLAASATDSPETAAASNVAAWTGVTADAVAQPGPTGMCDVLTAPVLAAAEPAVVAAVAVKADAPTTVTIQAAGFDADGAVNDTTAAVTFPVDTGWVVAAVAVEQSALLDAGSMFVLPRVVATDTTPLYLAAAQVEYGLNPSAWRRGYGCPRVYLQPPGRNIPAFGYTAHTLNLVER